MVEFLLKRLKKFLGYKDAKDEVSSNELSTCLLQLKILEFDEFYLATLVKFGIRSFEDLFRLEEKASLCHKNSMLNCVMNAIPI